jgi:hypothetical protein
MLFKNDKARILFIILKTVGKKELHVFQNEYYGKRQKNASFRLSVFTVR